MNSVAPELSFGLWEHVSLKHIEEKSVMPSSNWAARAFQKTFTNVFQPRGIHARRRRRRRPVQRISLESLEPRQMLSVNPAFSGSSASSANDSSSIAAFVSQNTIGILSTVSNSPTSVVAVSGNAQLAVTWVAPTNTGGSPITDYLVKYSSNSGSTWTNFVHPVSTALSCTVTGLTNGTSYVIKVIAKNAVGISLPSANSAPVIPAATVPSAPTSVVAVSGNAQLAVTWVAPASTGGSPITDYLVKYSSNGGSTWTRFFPSSGLPVTTTSCTVTGLTNGTAYVIKVIARNAVGISLPSSNSAPVTPLAAALTPTFGSTTATATGFTVQITNYNAAYTWAGTATASGTVVVSGTGFVTVSNVAAGTS
ncbi:MAG: fibronectin type III domain-containing protein, partial [Planctomycetota bacterium]